MTYRDFWVSEANDQPPNVYLYQPNLKQVTSDWCIGIEDATWIRITHVVDSVIVSEKNDLIKQLNNELNKLKVV